MTHRAPPALLALLCFTTGAAEPTPPRSPADELATFRFADPALSAELVAAEPLVSSPVALAWDETGHLFVAEMRDYPKDHDGGSVRRLEDRDGDGRYETATVFADRLPFPNSVLPWNGGVLVTAAPDLWFLKDTDGDGVADERRVLFTGFGTGNQQLRANGLYWGLDGWVYGANGRSDGAIRPGGNSNAPAVSLRGRDFRFRPDTGEFETLAGRSQFGHTRDDWGNRFLSWNTIPLRHEVIPDAFLARNPATAAADPLQDCLPPGDRGEVFPLTPPPLVFNNESGSHFNALSGLHIFRGNALGPDYAGNAFVGESLRNLVHRRVLVPDGPTFRAERREEGREFLAATDPWFHPVAFATGPDGALYVADFYRRFVEHPDWVAREMREHTPWSEGREYGRLWRIRRRDVPRKHDLPAGTNNSPSLASLVANLNHVNGWQRDTAHRLMVERRDPAAIPLLEEAILSGPFMTPPGQVASLHAWSVLGGTSPAVLRAASSGIQGSLNAAAAQLIGQALTRINAEPSAPGTTKSKAAAQLRNLALMLARHPDPQVRLHALIALGSLQNEAFPESELASLATDTTNHWLLLALASSSRSPELAARALPAPIPSRPPPAPPNPNPDRAAVVARFEPALRLKGDAAQGAVLVARLCLSCHYLQGHGQRVGPDLSGAGTRPADALLVDLLDPSRQVAPDYVAYEIQRTSGDPLTGLIASETATRLTLRAPGSPDTSVARSEVREIRPTDRSLMPEGLEQGLEAQDLANLLAFLRSPDATLLPP
ncbi:MAG: hypothetical protein RIS76_2681 [Verrucomicrobiota bacterium]